MRALPIDQAGLMLTFINAVAKERDGRQIDRDVDGRKLPVWEVQVLCQADEVGTRPEVLPIAVPAAAVPAFPAMTPVDFINLVASAWQGERAGQGGVAFRADGVRQRQAPNGSSPKPQPAGAGTGGDGK